MLDAIAATKLTAHGRKPAVSIVIRNYNYGAFLRDAVESALDQTYPDVEVIVVDDGSSDSSRSILTDYEHRCHIVLRNNGGEGAAVNSGFALVRGDIVLFLDSDDKLARTAAAQIAARWYNGLTHAHFRMDVISQNGAATGDHIPYRDIPAMDLDRYMASFGCIPCGAQSCNAYAAHALRRILPLDANVWQRGPDCYLNALCAAQGETRFFAESIGWYRRHNANLSMRNSLFRGERPDAATIAPNLFADLRRFVGEERWQRMGAQMPSGHWLNRILSLRLNPGSHPFPQDRVLTLGANAWQAIARHPLLTTQRRLLFLAGLWTFLFLPAPLLRSLLPAMLRFSRLSGQPGWIVRRLWTLWQVPHFHKHTFAADADFALEISQD